jgi:hypothetical protein
MHKKALALAPLLLAACSNDFAPYSKLDRLRVLAIRAEPPNPAPGERCELDALIFAPSGEPVSYRWGFCPVQAQAQDAYACPIDEALAQAILGSSPPFDLGTADTADFTNPFPASLLAQLCANGLRSGDRTLAIECNPDYRVTVTLDVATSGDSLQAAFTVNLPASDTPEINANPTVLGLSVDGTPLTDVPTLVPVQAGASVSVAAQLSADSVEQRMIPPAEGGSGVRKENLIFSWFADAGSLDKDRTVYLGGETGLDQAAQVRWTPPAAGEWPDQGLVNLAVVVRDDRGGVGWLSRRFQIGGSP